MDTNADNLFFQVPRRLWGQAVAQAEARHEPLAAPSGSLLAAVNEWRASQHWPLCTDMLPVALPECDMDGMIPEDTRALWQMGLLQHIKKNEAGLGMMRRALVPLCAHPETWFGQIALGIDQIILSEDACVLYPQALMHCFMQFERQLKEPTAQGLRALWESVHFYATLQLVVSDAGKAALKMRIQHVAGILARMLVVKDSEDTTTKNAVFPYYLTLVDGLLFLGEDRLAERLETMYGPLPPQLLNISVPVQKLWAQCASLSVRF